MKLIEKNQLLPGLAWLFLLGVSAMAQPGFLDPSFGNGGRVMTRVGSDGEGAKDVAIQPDGKIVVVAFSYGANGPYFAVLRYNPNGTLDTSFNNTGVVILPDYGDTAEAVALQPDGKIVVGGTYSGAARNAFKVARLNADGTLDAGFGDDGMVKTFFDGGHGTASDLALQPDGKIVLAGFYYRSTSGEDFCLVRYNRNGSLDTTFGSDGILIPPLNGYQRANSVAVASNAIVIAGCTHCGSSSSDFAIVFFDFSGNIFRPGFITTPVGIGEDAAYGLEIQRDGKIVAAGMTKNDTRTDTAIVRYNANGTLDTTFDGDGKVVRSLTTDVYIKDVAIQQNGKIVVAGTYRSLLADPNNYFLLQRFNPNGSNDLNFAVNNTRTYSVNNGFDSDASAFALQADGRIVEVGNTDGFPGGIGVIRAFGDSRTRADFDGDGKTDLSLFRPSNGQWWYQNSSDYRVFAAAFGVGKDRIVPGDYDDDGKTDIAVFRPSTNEWFILRSSNFSYYSVPFGLNGDIPAQADYDGDWKTDVAIFRPSTGHWYISKSSGGVAILQWGLNGDRPVPEDYDADGRADIGVFRPADGSWWINRTTAGYLIAAFGTGTDLAVPADYTGDGRADVAVWRPSNGNWYVLRSEDGSYFSIPFGMSGDIPVLGNFDGDGKADFGIFRPSSGTWYIEGSRWGTMIQQFGIAGDVPVP